MLFYEGSTVTKVYRSKKLTACYYALSVSYKVRIVPILNCEVLDSVCGKSGIFFNRGPLVASENSK